MWVRSRVRVRVIERCTLYAVRCTLYALTMYALMLYALTIHALMLYAVHSKALRL